MGKYIIYIIRKMSNQIIENDSVIAFDRNTHFYQNCGFEKSNDESPMFIKSL